MPDNKRQCRRTSPRARWPWITTALAAILVLNPIGLEVLYLAFLSGEALSGNIARPLVLTAGCILAFIGFLEHLMWKAINSKPNSPAFSLGAGSTRSDKTET